MEINILGKIVSIESYYDSITLLEQYNKLINAIISYVSILSKYAYFNDKLWKKVRKTYIDELELNMAFLSTFLFDMDIYISPVGSTFCITDKNKAKEFIDQFKDVWSDYVKWCNSQR